MHLDRQLVGIGSLTGFTQHRRVAGVNLAGGKHRMKPAIELAVPADTKIDAVTKSLATVIRIGFIPDLSARRMPIMHGPESGGRVASQTNRDAGAGDRFGDRDIAVSPNLVVIAQFDHRG